MQVWNGIESYPANAGPVVGTVGNYDGLHLGHQRIIDSVLAEVERCRIPSLLVTFDPHPMSVVAPNRRPRLLMTRGQKLERLEEAGIDGVLILKFDKTLASLSGEEFFTGSPGSRIRFAALHVGDNFRFGRGRAGDLDLLRRIGSERGFDVVGVPAERIDGDTVSSSAVRDAVAGGDVARAWRLLGRPFELSGEVARGDGRGKNLGFPTANLAVENELVPRPGVYVTETTVFAARYPSVANVGIRPTFGGRSLVVETHLLDLDEDLYEQRLAVRFLARLRDERRFEHPSELADQIARDRAAAATYFQSLQLQTR